MRIVLLLAVILVSGSGAVVALLAWRRDAPDPPAVSQGQPELALAHDTVTTEPARIRFADLAKVAGITFRHIDSPSSIHYVPEIMGGGAAWLDFDQDGYLDLFLVQGGKFPPDPNEKRTGPTSRLYRNMGDGTFADVTDAVGIWHPGFGQGVAVGDYDNDGYPDLFVACYGHCHLFHNEPDGKGGRRFREVTKEAGIEADGWCTSCAFGDLFGTGYLDLFVCRYVVMDLAHYPFCGKHTTDPPIRFACGPKEFKGSQSLLFHNNGNGTFTNVSKQAGLDTDGKGLGVLILDFDDDGKVDIFVGNDEVPNSHYRNLGNGKLESCALLSGTAANYQGMPMGSMGVEAGDLTGNGRPDIFVTTFYHEGTALFRNDGKNLFTDVSQKAGMREASWNRVGWGTCLFDADHDGLLDVFVVNGHVYRNVNEMDRTAENGEVLTFGQPAQLFLGDGKGHFRQVADAGPYFKENHVGRGVAMGDYDNDGHMDIAVNNCGEPAALLHNETQTPYHWVRLQLEGNRHRNPAGSNRDAIGAKVKVKAGGRTIVHWVKGGGSYYSTHERRLLIGLGAAERVEDVEVRWPNAKLTVQHFGPLAADRSYKLVEGGAAEPALCPPLKKASR
jgi:hypothetical protein